MVNSIGALHVSASYSLPNKVHETLRREARKLKTTRSDRAGQLIRLGWAAEKAGWQPPVEQKAG